MPKLSTCSGAFVGGVACWSSCVSPVHGFGNCLVEILHESLEFLDQVELGTEAASSDHATIDDAENDNAVKMIFARVTTALQMFRLVDNCRSISCIRVVNGILAALPHIALPRLGG